MIKVNLKYFIINTVQIKLLFATYIIFFEFSPIFSGSRRSSGIQRHTDSPPGPEICRVCIPEREFLSAGMKFAGKIHPCERIFIGRDEICRGESSLREDFYRQGWNLQGRIIPARGFLSAGMKSAGKNHPQERIFIGRDEICGEEASLREDFYWQG